MTIITYAERKGIQKGIKEGLKKGIEKGRQEGRQEGKIEGLRKAIESVLEVKFGSMDESISKQLFKIQSVAKLEKLLHQAKLVNTLDKFRDSILK